MAIRRIVVLLFSVLLVFVAFQNCGMTPQVRGLVPTSIVVDPVDLKRGRSTTGTNPGDAPGFVEVPSAESDGGGDDGGNMDTAPNYGDPLLQSLCSFLYYSGATNFNNDCISRLNTSSEIARHILAEVNSSTFNFDYIRNLERNFGTTYMYSLAAECYTTLLVYQRGEAQPSPRPSVELDFEELELRALEALALSPGCKNFIIENGVVTGGGDTQ